MRVAHGGGVMPGGRNEGRSPGRDMDRGRESLPPVKGEGQDGGRKREQSIRGLSRYPLSDFPP